MTPKSIFASALGVTVVGVMLAAALAVGGCSNPKLDAALTTHLSTRRGQLFCLVQTHGGGAAIVGVLDAEASAVSPSGAPVAVLANGLAKQKVDALCDAAGKSVGGSGDAVSPPLDPLQAAQIAVVVSAIQTIKP